MCLSHFLSSSFYPRWRRHLSKNSHGVPPNSTNPTLSWFNCLLEIGTTVVSASIRPELLRLNSRYSDVPSRIRGGSHVGK